MRCAASIFTALPSLARSVSLYARPRVAAIHHTHQPTVALPQVPTRARPTLQKQWDVVEVNGIPQPGAYAHHPPGSSYEEFLLTNNVAYPPRLRVPEGTRMLKLIHKRTRSVCSSRKAEVSVGRHRHVPLTSTMHNSA